MITLGHVFCDLCDEHMGQLWNESVAARDLLPAPAFHVCLECHSSCICSCGQAGCWFAARSQCVPAPEVAA